MEETLHDVLWRIICANVYQGTMNRLYGTAIAADEIIAYLKKEGLLNEQHS